MVRNRSKAYKFLRYRLQNTHSKTKVKKDVDSGVEIYRMHPTATMICLEISRLNNSLGVLIVEFAVCLVDV